MDLKIAFRTKSTIENLLKHWKPILEKFSSSGVYKLTCPDCHIAYVGQTGRRLYTRYNEHKVISTTTAAPLISHSTSMISLIPLATSTTSCRCYTTKRKEHI